LFGIGGVGRLKPSVNRSTKRVASQEMRKNTVKYLVSFLIMILFTAIAFYLIIFPVFDTNTTFWAIFLLAWVQAILQLFTFMHLDQRGYGIVIIMYGVGLLIAVVSGVGIVLMP
jgi:cytochrome c oxidase subunit 4